jgi:thiamine biosynthesis lipoprotein
VGDTVRLRDPDARLDLGGIAKGYIADRMADLLTERGVKSAIIDLGGNIVTVGQKTNGAAQSGGQKTTGTVQHTGTKENAVPWIVGVRNPFPQDDGQTMTILGTIRVDGRKSVGSSGTYERYFEVDGVRYHHILDPETGYPAGTDLAGVTVVTDLSVDGEGCSTYCILLGAERAQAFLEENHIQAVLVKEDGSVITTSDILYTPVTSKSTGNSQDAEK